MIGVSSEEIPDSDVAHCYASSGEASNSERNVSRVSTKLSSSAVDRLWIAGRETQAHLVGYGCA